MELKFWAGNAETIKLKIESLKETLLGGDNGKRHTGKKCKREAYR